MATTIIIISVICLLILFSGEKKNEHDYHATFGNKSDHFSLFNHGFSVGEYSLTKKQSFQNVLCLGPTGSGKSQSVITRSIISLARGKSSMVIFDPSGAELFTLLSGYLDKKGYKVVQYNFMDSRYSECFNPLSDIQTVNDAQKTALLLIRNTIGENKSDPFWENSAVMLISLMIRFLVFHCEPQHRTLQNVLRLIETFAVDGDAISRLILQTSDEGLLQNYKSTLVMGEKTLQSVISTARTALNLWNDSEVVKTTCKSSISFEDLRNDEYPIAIFITNPLRDLDYCKPISCLFIQKLIDYSLERIPDEDERSIFFVIEEASTMKFPNLSKIVSNIRKFCCGILLCVQDEDALVAQYGKAEAHQVRTNCGCRIYLKGSPAHTAKELSDIMGRYTIPNENRSRELMTADEIRMCEQAIVLVGHHAPILINPVPLYKSLWYRHLAKPNPIEVTEKNIDKPPLLNLL
ncbi:type IV secretory system conjugative DNA transfer family protein [Sediminibacterium sp.]|uniref:type IV secretory system conjugative DNA transfer family protein n=1 Tax=Sediminibacterium sp. TaxID=1917865 RepID=UPI003F69AD57